jgi:sugar phosphate isomerase/epimerase
MPTINRRELLMATAATGVVAATGRTATADEATARVSGIQLYTVRDSMAEDVATTLKAIAGIGYREVEFAGYFDRSPAEIRGMLDDLGLTSPSTHIDGESARDNPMPFVETAAEIGHDYVTIAWMRPENRKTIDDFKRWAEVANRLGEACRGAGMRAAYHNHDFEFQALDGKEPFALLLAETDPELVYFELDFYWTRFADQDIRDVIGRAPERFVMSHIKDMDAEGNMVSVGAGTIDFGGILDDPVAASIRHCFVEHDNPADPFRSVAYSHQSMRTILR